jgi:hypothetical protein
MAFEQLRFLAGQRQEESPAAAMARQARQAAERQDHDDAKADAERQAAIDEAAEARALGMMQAGLAVRSMGDIITDASRESDEDAEYCEVLKTIERID